MNFFCFGEIEKVLLFWPFKSWDLQYESPRKRFLSSSDQTVSQKTKTTPTLDRVALLSEVIITGCIYFRTKCWSKESSFWNTCIVYGMFYYKSVFEYCLIDKHINYLLSNSCILFKFIQANRFLSDDQINQFISSTVLPSRHISSGTQSVRMCNDWCVYIILITGLLIQISCENL